MTAAADHVAAVSLASLDDVRAKARATLEPDTWDFVEGGSGAESTLGANRAAFDELMLIPRVLTGVTEPDTRARLVGTDAALPMAVAPMAYQRLVHHGGEIATARAARAAGIPLTVSTLSSCSLEDLAATGATLWFQLYCLRDRAMTHQLIARAEEAGCRALMVTVDVPLMARRPRDIRNGFALRPQVRAALVDSGPASTAHRRAEGTSAVAAHTNAAFAPGLSWHDLADLRSRTSLPLVLKGVLDPDDARTAADTGADAVVVSSHGGRQLDGCLPSMRALPSVVAAVRGDCEVLVDSGVRSGLDVLRALALGARGVLLGRPVLWGLAGGEHGVAEVLSLVGAELREAMTLAGCDVIASARALRTERMGRHG